MFDPETEARMRIIRARLDAMTREFSKARRAFDTWPILPREAKIIPFPLERARKPRGEQW
jgi:hypothetical protein